MARKVLIADDSPTVQKKAGGILTGEGYEVVTVSNGVAAVKKLPAVMPLVVLADVAMPGKDGYEVCEFVKNHDALKTVSVLLVFSETDPIEEERAARAHADGRISKPFSNPEELISVVGRYAAMAEAAVSEPAAQRPSPPHVYVTEPMDAEPELEPKQEFPDMSGFSGGIGIGESSPEEQYASAPPPPDPVMEATPAAEMPPETQAPTYEPTEPESPPVSAEPVLVEESAPTTPPPPEEEESPPDRTMLFHAPAEIAEPVLSEEAAETEAAPEDSARRPDSASRDEAEISALAASTLESFSLHDAESGQVRFSAEEETEAAPEPIAPSAAASKTFDEAQVFSIVHQVVAKMSPPALSPQMVEDIARRVADEVIRELNSQP